ncbi:MAG: hypothetical protein ACE5HS_14220 [bacterium]
MNLIFPDLFASVSCPVCEEDFDFRIFGLCSGLGPSKMKCACSCIVDTGRCEWADFQGSQRTKFFMVTAVYVLASIFFGGCSTWIWYHFGWLGLDALKLNLLDPAFVFGAGVSPVLLLFLQRFRIFRSQERKPSKHREAQPVPLAFWNLDFNLQIKAAAVWIFISLALTFLARILNS